MLGILIRILIIPFTGHWDLTSLHVVASSLFKNGPLSFYYTDIAIYPPLTYITLAIWQIIIRPFVEGDFYRWLGVPIIQEFYAPHVFRYFFLLKLMFIPFEMGTGYILSKFGRDKEESKKILLLWLFNPIVLYIVYMWTTIDIITAFFAVLGIYMCMKKNPYLGFILFGIGALYKIWPLLLLPFAIILSFQSTRKKIIGAFVGLLPFILVITPYLRIPTFRTYVLASDRISLIGNAGLYIGFLQWLLIYLLIYVLGILLVNKYLSGQKERLIDVSLIVLMIFFVTSAFTPQWFMWVLPFLILQLAKYKKLFGPFLLIMAGYVLVILSFDIALSFGLFAPIEPTLWQTPFVKEYVEMFFKDANKIWSIFRTINSAFLIWFIFEWYLIKRKENEKNI